MKGEESVPICKRVLNVVTSRINENSRIVPGSTLDLYTFMDSAQIFHLFVTDGNGYGKRIYRNIKTRNLGLST